MDSIRGCSKFLDRVYNLKDLLVEGENYSAEMEKSNDIKSPKQKRLELSFILRMGVTPPIMRPSLP